MNTNFQILKSSFLNLMLACALVVFSFSSCTDEPKDSPEVAEDQNEAKFDNSKEDEAAFLVNAAEIHMEEMELGKLAQNKGTMSDVKELGKMMDMDHGKALADLQALAGRKSISLPSNLSNDTQEAYKKLSDKTGKDFDKEYCDMMVKGHKDAIEKFEKAANESTDTDIKGWASSMLPTLRMHLDHSMTCYEKADATKK